MVGMLAFFLDCILGDPRSRFHPVVLMGQLISLLEKLLYRAVDSNGRKMVCGFLLAAVVSLFVYAVSRVFLQFVAGWDNYYLNTAVQALLLSFMISPRSLAAAGREIHDLLLQGNLEQARDKVGWIVGRDTEKLSSAEVTRATVETIAENIVDGILSPLFFFVLGGVPLAVLYRAVNTMDSMIGYKNEKYLYFGRAAARLDDVLNYIPARITGCLIVVAASLLRLDFQSAWRIMQRDASAHPSPNGGYAEAPVAGALGIRLGGRNSYFGRTTFRAYMGEPLHALSPVHITQTIRIMYTVTVVFLCILLLLTWRP